MRHRACAKEVFAACLTQVLTIVALSRYDTPVAQEQMTIGRILVNTARSLARRKIALLGAGTYLAAFFCASLYPFFDHRTFSGLAAVLLAWPWIDYMRSAMLPFAVALNTILIYSILAAVSRAVNLLRTTPG
jgi:hypothetical protein